MLIDNAPDMPEIEHDGGSTLRKWACSSGIAIDSRTNMPMWDGSPIDYGAAIDGLRPI